MNICVVLHAFGDNQSAGMKHFDFAKEYTGSF
jgi:hypothetical protein